MILLVKRKEKERKNEEMRELRYFIFLFIYL